MSFRHLQNKILLLTLLYMISLLKTTPADVTGRYKISQPTWIAYINLTQAGSKATGYIQYVYADDQNITRTQKSDIHGEVNGNRIVLKLNSFLGYGGGDANGKKSGGKLILEFPMTNGRIQTYKFTPTTTNAWNQSVTAFQKHWTQKISVARTNVALTARKRWLGEQDTKITIAIFDKQGDLAGSLAELDTAKSELLKWQKETDSRQKIYEDSKASADKATQNAGTNDERSSAWELQSLAQNAKIQVDEAAINAKSAKIEISACFNSIESDKAEIQGMVRQIRTLQAEMRGYKMEFGEAPDLGKFMAIVVTSSAKITATRNPNSNIVREVREKTYLGVIGINYGSASVILPGGQSGEVNKADLRLISLETIGRPKFGRLGIVTALTTTITQEQDEDSKVLTIADRDTYLCITKEQKGWYGVLMQNGAEGWVKRETILLLNHDVIRNDDGKLDSPGTRR